MTEEFKKIIEKFGIKNAEILTDEDWFEKKIKLYNETEGELDKDDYNCPLCKNKGDTAFLSDDGYEVHRQCSCLRTRAVIKKARESGLGDVINDYTFAKFEASEAWQLRVKETAEAFCKDGNAKWFYAGGQVGSGKSHICTAIAAHYLKNGFNIRYMIWAEDAKRLKAIVNEPEYRAEVESFKDADVLYIDDFLKIRNGESPTTGDLNLAFEILNHRLLKKEKITIISSEKFLGELMNYDEAIASRIYQACGAYKVEIKRDRKRNYRLK